MRLWYFSFMPIHALEAQVRRAAAENPHTYRAPNATDLEKLGEAAADGPLAPELAGLPRPVIGYVGQIADKMNYELIDQVARTRTNWSFVFVGPVWSSKRERVATLEALSNVHFLGARLFDQLVPYLRGFDVCMLPHLTNPLTRSMDPIKLYDYLSTGKPIVSTSVAGTERFLDVLYLADNPADFVRCIEDALGENGQLVERRLSYARRNTWSQRARDIWQVISQQPV